jgi:hypothetical protein
MSKSDAFENQLLLHLFNNSAIANVGDGTGLPAAATPGSLYVRLYTSAVTVDDSTIGTECAYTGYVQYGVAVARSAGGWTVSANNASNTAAITFGACTAGSETVRYFAIWKTNVDVTAANRLYWGQLTSDLAVSSGITPEFAIGALDVNED